MGHYRKLRILVWPGWLLTASAHAGATSAAAGHGLQGLMLEVVGLAIVVGVFAYAVKCFLWPGEKSARHIKRRILRDRW